MTASLWNEAGDAAGRFFVPRTGAAPCPDSPSRRGWPPRRADCCSACWPTSPRSPPAANRRPAMAADRSPVPHPEPKAPRMSHIVTVAAKATDPAALAAACTRLKLPTPASETVTFFDRSVRTGLAVRPPGFVYPVVCDTATGDLYHDTYEGRWGDESFVGRLLQAYAVEAAKLQAKARGHRCTETALADGGVKLTVTAGAAGFGGAPQSLTTGEAA